MSHDIKEFYVKEYETELDEILTLNLTNYVLL